MNNFKVIVKLQMLLMELRANDNWYMAQIVEQILIDLVNETK